MGELSLKQIVILAYGAYLIFISLITFFAYAIDKRKAIKKKYRTPEKILLTLSLLGGAFLGYPSMLIFRHKTTKEHWYFTFINILGIIIHLAILLTLIFFINF